MAARHLVALGLFAIVVTPSCVSTLGLDEEQRSAVESLCVCPQMGPPLYSTKAACVAELESRLERVTEPTRAAWMKNFAAKFTGCTPESVNACFRMKPTCEATGDCPGGTCELCCNPGAPGKCA